MAERFALLDFAYAHRGLWSPEGLPENSLEAILAAAEAGLGCELDVRPAACGTPVVFHDERLERTTGLTGYVAERTAEELAAAPLSGGGTLPTLQQALEAWPRDTPLLIEIKIDGDTDAVSFTEHVSEMVAAHAGPAAIMSFSPQAVGAIPKDLMRGALILPSLVTAELSVEGLVSTAAALQPDYFACHVTDAENVSALARDIGMPVAVWTVTSKEISDMLRSLPITQIFEGFDPAFARPG